MSDSQQAETWLDRVAYLLETLPGDLDAEWLLAGLRSARAIDPVASDIADFAREKPGLIPLQLLAATPVSSTTSFHTHLLRLEAVARLIDGCPGWRAVWVTETALAGHAPVVVDPAVLRSPSQYAHEFEVMLTRGFPWINMCAAGVIRDALLVEVEHAPVGHRGNRSSVNLSGPTNLVSARPGWSLDQLITLQS